MRAERERVMDWVVKEQEKRARREGGIVKERWKDWVSASEREGERERVCGRGGEREGGWDKGETRCHTHGGNVFGE